MPLTSTVTTLCTTSVLPVRGYRGAQGVAPIAGNGHRLPKYLSAGLMPGHPAEPVLYLTELAETRAHVLRPDTGDRLTLEWSARAFPYAWVWINQRATRFPWFGRLSSIAVEPVNVWPAWQDSWTATTRTRLCTTVEAPPCSTSKAVGTAVRRVGRDG